MLTNLRKLLLLIVFAASLTNVDAQSDVVIMGTIDNPISQYVSIVYKKNLFSFEDAVFETRLNEHNGFSMKVTIPEPRAVYFGYKNDKIKLFLMPADTLKLHFKGNDMLSTLTFEGITALSNKYLLNFAKKFPDLVDDQIIEKERVGKSPGDYQRFIDNLYFEKRRFFENYPTEDKDYFISDFLDYAANDITYWRTFQLMMYYKQHGLNNANNARFIDDNYFNFLFDTENVFYKALNNEYYLQFLELYLSYIRERDAEKYGKSSLDIVDEKTRQVQIATIKEPTVWVLEDPFASKNIITTLAQNDEVEFLNVTTDAEFTFTSPEVTYKDVYVQIVTKEGKKGWVPKSLINLSNKNVIEKKTLSRQCFLPNEPLCGFEAHLHGKALYYAALRDILLSLLKSPYDDLKKRVNAYTISNTTNENYNTILRSAYDVTLANRQKGLEKLYIPQSCFVEELKLDTKSKKNEVKEVVPDKTTVETATPAATPPVSEPVTNTAKPAAEKPVITSPVSEPIISAAKQIVEKSAIKPPVSEPTTNTTKPVVEKPLATPPVSEPVVPAKLIVEKPITAPEKKETTPPQYKPLVETQTQQTRTVLDTSITNTATGVNVIVSTKNVKELEKPVQNMAVPQPNAPAKSDGNSVSPVKSALNFEDKQGVVFETGQEIVPLPDMPDYKPDGKPIKFNGLVINEDIPIFELVDITGKKVHQQDLLGKIVFIDFWASWCGPCQAQLTHARILSDKYSDKDVVFIYISVDSDAEAWKTAVKEKNLPGIHANDKTLIPLNFGVQGLPNSFIIGKNGKVALNSMLKSKLHDDFMIEYLLKSQ